MQTKQIRQHLPSALTALSEPQMKAPPLNTEAWEKWLDIKTFNDPAIIQLVEVCGRFAKRIKDGNKPSWLSLLGKKGTGKTHCARKLWKWGVSRFNWTRCDYMGKEIYWPLHVIDLRAGDAFERMRDMTKWPLLFLDDIGAERDTTGFASEQLNTLLGCRVGRWTILTSNLSLEQLAAIDPRIADRIVREPGNLYTELDTVSFGLRDPIPNSPNPKN